MRVRFAPSPTGSLHVGGARTALFNWFFSRQKRGSFVLRIEDTDVARSSAEAESGVLSDLRWLGIEWDEGPDRGGSHGPYRQSERKGIYDDFGLRLLRAGKAYKCYCLPEELERRRQELLALGRSPHYDGRCRNLSQDECAGLEREGRKPSLRFLVEEKGILLSDIVRGEVQFPSGMVGDFIILRPDGMPTYNFSCVIDDHLMEISHVLRAEEHLPNTLRQLMLYEGLEMKPPRFAHLSLILNRHRAKLSKRDGAVSVSEFRELGYLPEAVVNYLSLLGWSPGDDRELMSVQETVEAFSLERATRAGAIFDRDKLDWMNGHYIRTLDVDHVLRPSLPFFRKTSLGNADEGKLRKILSVVRGGLVKLDDLPHHVSMFEEKLPEYEPDARRLLEEPSSAEVLSAAARLLEETDVSSQESARAWLDAVGRETGRKGRELLMPIRAALTGSLHGRELPLIIEILGSRDCRMRLEHASGGKT
ncbi:MAG: glutamate--tRNA ligase [Candidatus Eiseniibacteriota bacterium]|nr:MAG: glutamate--tRNA ligase [Candidatus Eisenbacteria bacterium]